MPRLPDPVRDYGSEACPQEQVWGNGGNPCADKGHLDLLDNITARIGRPADHRPEYQPLPGQPAAM